MGSPRDLAAALFNMFLKDLGKGLNSEVAKGSFQLI